MDDQVIPTPYTQITVDPLVIATVIEAAPRVGGQLIKCVCCLVGHIKDDGSLDVTDAFPNHHSEVSEGIEKVHHDLVWQARQKINPGEIVVGWASTDMNLQGLTQISDWAKSDQKASKFVPKKRLPSPLLMMVQLPTPETRLSIKAYIKGPVTNCLLKPAPFKIAQTASGLDLAMFAEPTNSLISASSINEAIKMNANPNAQRLDLLIQRIERTMQLVDDIIDGKVEADSDIGRMVFDAVAPTGFDPSDTSAVANAQDNILSLYMSNLVKLQFLIAEKLHLLLA